MLLDELDKTMQLGGDEERVNRVGEQQKVCRTQGILSFSKAFFYRMNSGTDMQVIKVNLLEMFFDEQDSLKCNAVFSGKGDAQSASRSSRAIRDRDLQKSARLRNGTAPVFSVSGEIRGHIPPHWKCIFTDRKRMMKLH